MTRWFIPLLSVCLIAAGVHADDKDKALPPEKPVKDELKPATKPAKPAEPTGESEEARILARLAKNAKTAEEKLAGTDTGDATRKLQRDILKDIDELLKKFQQPPQDSQDQQSSSSSSSSSSSQSKPSDGSASQQKPSGGSAQQKPSGGSAQQKPSAGQSSSKQKSGGLSRREQREQRRQQEARNGGTPKPMGGDPKPMDKSDGSKPGPEKTDATADGKDPKNPKGGLKDGKPRLDADARNPEMYKDVWGHLPEKMRQEMDSYFKERFMPRYNDLLKQYYSTIAEQNKKKP